MWQTIQIRYPLLLRSALETVVVNWWQVFFGYSSIILLGYNVIVVHCDQLGHRLVVPSLLQTAGLGVQYFALEHSEEESKGGSRWLGRLIV